MINKWVSHMLYVENYSRYNVTTKLMMDGWTIWFTYKNWNYYNENFELSCHYIHTDVHTDKVIWPHL